MALWEDKRKLISKLFSASFLSATRSPFAADRPPHNSRGSCPIGAASFYPFAPVLDAHVRVLNDCCSAGKPIDRCIPGRHLGSVRSVTSFSSSRNIGDLVRFPYEHTYTLNQIVS